MNNEWSWSPERGWEETLAPTPDLTPPAPNPRQYQLWDYVVAQAHLIADLQGRIAVLEQAAAAVPVTQIYPQQPGPPHCRLPRQSWR